MINLIYIAIHSMKEIEPPFLSTVLKRIVSNTDICSILNEKDNEGIVKQKIIIEPKQHNVAVKSKKSKRTTDEWSHADEYSNKII